MYYVLAHKPGGQPIGALDRIAGKAAKLVRRLMPKFGEAKARAAAADAA
jgi:lipopolysaccharide export system permease protein